MKLFSGLQIVLQVLFLAAIGGCAQFATIDRSEVNRPSMDLNSPMIAKNQSTLTNQKSTSGLSVGSCSVCAH